MGVVWAWSEAGSDDVEMMGGQNMFNARFAPSPKQNKVMKLFGISLVFAILS